MNKMRPLYGWAIVSHGKGVKPIFLGHGITKRQAYCKWRVTSSGECEKLVRVKTVMVKPGRADG